MVRVSPRLREGPLTSQIKKEIIDKAANYFYKAQKKVIDRKEKIAQHFYFQV